MSLPIRAAAYVRVSTGVQSTAMQANDIQRFVTARGWTLVRTFEDKASGTSTLKRPMLAETLRAARSREFDTLVVWKLDRFARSLKDLVTMLQELDEVGVQFISLRDNLDLTTSTGRLMMHMIGAFAQFEADIIRERVKAGVERAREKGKRFGRPPSLDRLAAIRLRNEGLSLSQIAERLGVTKSAVSKVLRKGTA